jgi:hypothetical protein
MKYRKKPVVIEAVQWTGGNPDALTRFVGQDLHWSDEGEPLVDTLEGDALTAAVDDYIIKGIQGEFYPCKPDIFEQTYERVTDDE